MAIEWGGNQTQSRAKAKEPGSRRATVAVSSCSGRSDRSGREPEMERGEDGEGVRLMMGGDGGNNIQSIESSNG